MSDLWEQLDKYAKRLELTFDRHMTRIDNPLYTDDLKFEGWKDLFWKSCFIRKAHLKIIDNRETQKLWLMHINIYPKVGIELPILGFDIVAGPNKITGSFMDYSPLHGYDHPYNTHMKEVVSKLEWKRSRELPDWALEIFSEDMIAVGNIRVGEELDQFIKVTEELTDYYLNNMFAHAADEDRDTTEHLNKYCINQKKNPHLHNSILKMGISEELKDKYINNILFEEIVDITEN